MRSPIKVLDDGAWAGAHFHAETVGGETVYDLSG
jgi:hypothetical protein